MNTSKLLGKSDECRMTCEGLMFLLSVCYETIAVLAGESGGS